MHVEMTDLCYISGLQCMEGHIFTSSHFLCLLFLTYKHNGKPLTGTVFEFGPSLNMPSA